MFAISQSESPWLDRVGILLSAGCAVHCLLMPIVLSLLAMYAPVLPTEDDTHRLLAIPVAAAGALALGRGYGRHRRLRPFAWLSAGLALIGAGALFGHRMPFRGAEIGVTLCGSCCMIAAHRLNHRFCKHCERCR